MKNYIDAEKLKAHIQYLIKKDNYELFDVPELLSFIDSLQQEQPDKETILRICKLHKAWSIIAPWENVEDFVITNWNSENIV